MKVTLEFITPNAELEIAKYAAICYDSKTDEESCNRRIKHLMSVDHLATLRFAYAVFHVSGISRACSHQFVRSKHLDFLQRSQRYVSEEQFEYVVPNGMDEGQEQEFRHFMSSINTMYKTLRDSGMKKEDCRAVLPNACTTELHVVGNLQAWKDFINLRNQPKAQEEIREVAIEIERLLSEHCPNIFK